MNNSVTRCIFETLTMKAAALILSALFFTSISGAASAHGLGEADIRNLAEAYGYVEYQKTALAEIAHSYPALAPDVLRFQRRFRLFKGVVIRRYSPCFKRFFSIGQRRQQPVHGRLIEVGVSVCRNRGFRGGTSRPERLKRRNGVIVFTIFLDGIE